MTQSRFTFIKQLGLLLLIAALFTMIFPEVANAASNPPPAATAGSSVDGGGIGLVLNRVVCMLTGTVGKAIATIAICVVGIGLFMGKLSWTLALATALGIGLIFGAASIVTWLAPEAQGSIKVGADCANLN
jgi:type IV secretory pathway VirB2 component (pilin)